MYKRILLAYDGSVEGRTALREGALLARQCGAEVFLLAVLVDTGTLLLPEVALAGASAKMEDDFTEIFNEGVARVSPQKRLGTSQGRLRRILLWWAIADRARSTAGGQVPRGLSDGLHGLQSLGCPECRQRRND